jgi:hypothetical protein
VRYEYAQAVMSKLQISGQAVCRIKNTPSDGISTGNRVSPLYFLPNGIHPATTYLDPEVFRFFGLIDDKAMQRNSSYRAIDKFNLSFEATHKAICDWR